MHTVPGVVEVLVAEIPLLALARSRAEVLDAAANRLRIELGGSGLVAEFVFPPGGGRARAVRLADAEFTRVAP